MQVDEYKCPAFNSTFEIDHVSVYNKQFDVDFKTTQFIIKMCNSESVCTTETEAAGNCLNGKVVCKSTDEIWNKMEKMLINFFWINSNFNGDDIDKPISI